MKGEKMRKKNLLLWQFYKEKIESIRLFKFDIISLGLLFFIAQLFCTIIYYYHHTLAFIIEGQWITINYTTVSFTFALIVLVVQTFAFSMLIYIVARCWTHVKAKNAFKKLGVKIK